MTYKKALPYVPSPLDVAEVTFDDSVLQLVEKLSSNAHEIWAKERVENGWRWGESRCDISKTHPCLVSYDELPESEKEYDRAMVEGTIKTIIALGYKVVRDA